MALKKQIRAIVSVMILVVAATSCESNFKDVQKMSYSEFSPSGEADNFNLKYTDSGRITSILKSPKMLDYGTVQYPFIEFPKGVEVTLFDKNQKKTYVKSDYAVTFQGTDIIDLQGNVNIWNESGSRLQTEQLYFDQKNEWFFTEKKFKFTDPKGVSNGQGVDFSKDFKVVNSQRISGEMERGKEL